MQRALTSHCHSIQWHTGEGFAGASDGDIKGGPCDRGLAIGAAVLVEILPQSDRALQSKVFGWLESGSA